MSGPKLANLNSKVGPIELGQCVRLEQESVYFFFCDIYRFMHKYSSLLLHNGHHSAHLNIDSNFILDIISVVL